MMIMRIQIEMDAEGTVNLKRDMAEGLKYDKAITIGLCEIAKAALSAPEQPRPGQGLSLVGAMPPLPVMRRNGG